MTFVFTANQDNAVGVAAIDVAVGMNKMPTEQSKFAK